MLIHQLQEEPDLLKDQDKIRQLHRFQRFLLTLMFGSHLKGVVEDLAPVFLVCVFDNFVTFALKVDHNSTTKLS